MQCPNPVCKRELFKVRVIWKQRIKDLPMLLPVELTCAHCGRKIKAYVLNENLRDVHSILKLLLEGQKMVYERLEGFRPPEERRGFFDALKRRFAREGGKA